MNAVFEGFLIPISPALSLILGAVLLTGLEGFSHNRCKGLKFSIALLSALLSLSLTCHLWTSGFPDVLAPLGPQPQWLLAFRAAYNLDTFSLAFYTAIAAFIVLSLVFMHFQFGDEANGGEIFLLTLFVGSGMMLLVSANSLLIVFLALELLSLPTYVLVGSHSSEKNSCEAALKYFLFGSFASVLLALAIAMLFGQFGTLDMSEMADKVRGVGQSEEIRGLLTYGGLTLFLVAAGFKIGLVPFHMWVPDVYQGAPTSITGFMGSAIKLTGFALLARILWEIFLPLSPHWIALLDILAIITMFVGNLAALKQNDLKRLFAYSSIAHAGYALMGITSMHVLTGPSLDILYYYLVVYGLMFLGLFACLNLIEKATGSTDISELSGIGFTHPFLSLCIMLFVISAAGIPPTAGFFAKYFIFLQAAQVGKTPLVVIAFLTSAIAAYYYMRVLVYLYMKDAKEKIALPSPKLVYLGITLCAFSILYFAVLPMSGGLGAFQSP